MTVNRERWIVNRDLTRHRTAAACLVVCLAASLPAAAQTQEAKPETAAEKPQSKKEKAAPAPRPRRESRGRDPGEERPRLDVPVSFPVDI